MPTELLSDYDFQPNIREIRNQIELAYYGHDDQQIANYVNQLGKALETLGYYEEAEKCHMLDARISMLQKNNTGFLIALANLVLSLGMERAGDDRKTELDLGYFRLLQWDVSGGPEIEELVWRKFIFSVHYACGDIIFPDPNAVNFLVTNEYLELLDDFKHETNYWECLIAAAGTLLQFGFVEQASLYISTLATNRGCFRHNPLVSLAYHEINSSLQLLTENEISEETKGGILDSIQELGDQDADEVVSCVKRLMDEVVAFSAVEEVSFIKNLLRDVGQQGLILQFCEEIQMEPVAGFITQDEYLIFCINNNQFRQDIKPDSISLIHNYHIYQLLKYQYTTQYRPQSMAATIAAVIDGIDKLDPNVQFGAADLLIIIERLLLIHFDFKPAPTVNEAVKATWHIVKRCERDDDQLEDFVELLLNTYHRNRAGQEGNSEILGLMHIETAFSPQYCAEKLAESIGYTYSEEDLTGQIAARTSIDELMLASGLITELRQSEKQIFQNSDDVKRAPNYKKRRGLKRIAEACENNGQTRSMNKPGGFTLNKAIKAKNSLDDFIVSDSVTESISEDSNEVLRLSDRPKLLTKSITSSSVLSPPRTTMNVPTSIETDTNDLNLGDLDNISELNTLSVERRANDFSDSQNTGEEHGEEEASSTSLPQSQYQQFQAFISSNNFDALPPEEKVRRYHEFLLLEDLLAGRTQTERAEPETQHSRTGETFAAPYNSENQRITPNTVFSNLADPIQFKENPRKLTDRIVSAELMAIRLHGIHLDADLCSAIGNQVELEELLIEQAFVDDSNIIGAVVKLPHLKNLILYLYDMSATQALDIVVASTAEEMRFTGVIGLDSSPYENLNKVNQRRIKRLWFTRCNFYDTRPADIIAGLLEIEELGFWSCLYKETFEKQLHATCEVEIMSIIGD